MNNRPWLDNIAFWMSAAIALYNAYEMAQNQLFSDGSEEELNAKEFKARSMILIGSSLLMLIHPKVPIETFHNLRNRYTTWQNRNKVNLDDMPDEILLKIFDKLSPYHLAKVSTVSNKFHSLSKDQQLSVKLPNIHLAFFNESFQHEKFKQKFRLKKDDYLASLGEDSRIVHLKIAMNVYNHNKNQQKAALGDPVPVETDGYFDGYFEYGIKVHLGEIIKLLELGTNVSKVPDSNAEGIIANTDPSPELSALEYAENYEEGCPELLALLKEYKNFQENEKKCLAL